MGYRAVIFDLGGVVLDSPLHVIADYEREQGIPTGLLNEVVRAGGATGAWAQLERGELELDEFCEAFDRECAARGHVYPARAVMERIAGASRTRPEMIAAIERIREHGLAVAALTNNWRSDGQDRHALRPHFDHFIESSLVGLRKPDPAIYELALSRLGVEPGETVFLDDIGGNLKPARALGLSTIKVTAAEGALAELADMLGFPLGV